MFIAAGIITIVLGAFILTQGVFVSGLSLVQKVISLSNTPPGREGVPGIIFLLLAVCMILAGAFSIAGKNGIKRKQMQVSSVFYLAAWTLAFNNRGRAGEMLLWTMVLSLALIGHVVWYSLHPQYAPENDQTPLPPE